MLQSVTPLSGKYDGFKRIMLGDYFAAKREEKGWSQRELSRRCGVSYTQIQKIENGETDNPGVKTIMEIAKSLNIDPARVLLAVQGKNPDEADLENDKELISELESMLEKMKKQKGL